MKIYKSPQFPDNRAWFQSGFADGWNKPHPYGIDGAYFAQRTPRSMQRVGGVMTPPYNGRARQTTIWSETDQHIFKSGMSARGQHTGGFFRRETCRHPISRFIFSVNKRNCVSRQNKANSRHGPFREDIG